MGTGGGRVSSRLDKVEVATDEGVDIGVCGIHSSEEAAIEGEVSTRFHVDIEELERSPVVVKRGIDT